jgi:heme/copper-type cytochrome/quinol oxidase subunit 4
VVLVVLAAAVAVLAILQVLVVLAQFIYITRRKKWQITQLLEAIQ